MSEKNWGWKATGSIYIEGEMTEEGIQALIRELNLSLNKYENSKDGSPVDFFGMAVADVVEKPSDSGGT